MIVIMNWILNIDVQKRKKQELKKGGTGGFRERLRATCGRPSAQDTIKNTAFTRLVTNPFNTLEQFTTGADAL